ncbi:MAG: DNA mismatch repair protein MutS [Deltaproteobacteria bacterium]|nr:DNA mismatch repair protein MutS [Deltaproteobacteria bacterium]
MTDAAPTLTGDRKLTPMLQQYLAAKAEHPAAILMFRMGDFFEMFFDDAVVAARELDLVLTSRDKDKGEAAIPMAGVPHHAVTSYIARLVDHGHTVAICDQVEDPRLAKGLVKREITRVVTPGTVSDLEALDPVAPSYVASLVPLTPAATTFAVAMLDLLAGELLVTRAAAEGLADELDRMGVREVLVDPTSRDSVRARTADRLPLTVVAADLDPEAARALLSQRFGRQAVSLESNATHEQRALARLVQYADTTQRRVLRHLMPPCAYRATEFLAIDQATRRNLELAQTLREGRRQGSLLAHLDRCRTAMGSRLLHHWLFFPLADSSQINRRLDAVALLCEKRQVRTAADKALDGVRDLERLLGRLAIGRATPHDLALVRSALQAAPRLQAELVTLDGELGRRWAAADLVADVAELLTPALADAPPAAAADGGIFRAGYSAKLDELASAAGQGHEVLVELERRERQRTGIANLKVRYNRVFGYYIEVTRANLRQVPADYVRKQTLVGAERFITEELKRFEDQVTHADLARATLEAELWDELVQQVSAQAVRLRTLSRLLALTDATSSLAAVADLHRYVRPELCSAPVLELEGSRHPVVERLMPGGERFVQNDLALDAATTQLAVITGPNMAGKSTLMRQAALSVILAHMGSFVPATRARIGLCDRIFTRVGAADDLGRGQSTFMVEMMETAVILRNATAASLVLLDEIGRGTSTFDGVSIAWAVAEYLHDRIGCRAMFATHYHELADLARERPRIVNWNVAVKQEQGAIVFLRKLALGPANRSYGIEVARLAALPEVVLARAREVLANLEAGELDAQGMPLLAASRRGSPAVAAPTPEDPEAARVAAELAALDLSRLTPIAALNELFRLQKLVQP